MTTTQIVMASAVVLLLGYDCYAVFRGGVKNTISWQMTALSQRYPFIPFAMGFLMGHFYAQILFPL